jgi:uncharacterized protein (TIGR03435 family)
MRRTGFAALLYVVFGLFGARDGLAQSPAFEVAAIKLNTDLPIMAIGPGLRNGTLHGEKVTLKRLLAVAYGMTEPRVVGPDWLDNNRFDIMAKSPEGVPDSELKPMLQALLKERFKLTAHLETRKMPVYYLVVAKGGVKMAVYPAPARRLDTHGARGGTAAGTGTAARIADALTRSVGQPVIDKTGLTERYDYRLVYAPLSPQARDAAADFTLPDIFAAVQEQLGLKLEPGKDDVEVVVVDHVERMPTEN